MNLLNWIDLSMKSFGGRKNSNWIGINPSEQRNEWLIELDNGKYTREKDKKKKKMK